MCKFQLYVFFKFPLKRIISKTYSKAYFQIMYFSNFRLDRDAKLGALEERAEALQDGCKQFEQQAAAMKNKFWLENLKSMIMMGVVAVIVLGLLYWKFMMPQPNPYANYPPPPPPPPPAAPAPAAAAPAAEAGGDDADSSSAGGDGGGAADEKFV